PRPSWRRKATTDGIPGGIMPLRPPSPGRAAILASALTAALSLPPATHGQTPTARVLPPAGPTSRPAAPAGSGATTAPPRSPQPVVQRLTLEEAKQRVVANSKLLALAATNIDAKGYATRALRANYFPQIVGNAIYFHFNDDLGTIVTTPGRHVNGPRGRPLINIASATINRPALNENSSLTTVAAVQPLTAWRKVRADVQAAGPDQEMAQAQLDKGRRELVSGTEQLFWGLLAVQRLRAGALEAVRGAEPLAQEPSAPVEVRLALAEAQQALQQAEGQLADLQEQMTLLLDQPTCTQLELVEPAVPPVPVTCADEAVHLALATSPDVRE